MQLNDIIAVWRTSTANDNEYAFAVPRHLCEVLFPSMGKHLLCPTPEPKMAFARLADFSKEGVDDKSRFRITVFPYKTPADLNNIYRVRGRMENKPGAMFVVAWILEHLSCLNFMSSTGIDAHDGRGILDALLAFDTSRGTRLLKNHFSGPDQVAEYIYHLKQSLLGTPSFKDSSNKHDDIIESATSINGEAKNLSDKKMLGAAIQCAKKAIGFNNYSLPNCPLISDAAHKWELFWNNYTKSDVDTTVNPINFFPEFGASTLSAAPYYINRSSDRVPEIDDSPILRIEKSFSNIEIEAFDKWGGRDHLKVMFEPILEIPMVNERDLDIIKSNSYCLKIKFTHSDVERLRNFLPDTPERPTFATIGINALSGTLSVFLKPKDEVVRQFSVTIPSTSHTSSVSDFALRLFSKEFDLRTLFDRYEDSTNAPYNHTIEFTAAVEKSPIGLQYLGDNMAAAMLRKTDQFSESGIESPDSLKIKVSQPYNIRNEKECLEVICSCLSESEFCAEGYCAECLELRVVAKNKGKGVFQKQTDYSMVMTASNGQWIASACLLGSGINSSIPFKEYEYKWRSFAPYSSLLAVSLGTLIEKAAEYASRNTLELRKILSDLIVEGWNPMPPPKKQKPKFRNGTEGELRSKEPNSNTIKFKINRNLKSGNNGEVYLVMVTARQAHGENEITGLSDEHALKILLEPTVSKIYQEMPSKFPENTTPAAKGYFLHIPGHQDDQYAILMDKLEGADLEDCTFKNPHKFSLQDIANWLVQTGKHLIQWDEEGYKLVHWDIKPGNIFFETSGGGGIKLIDFGLIGEGSGTENECEKNIEKYDNLAQNDWQTFGSKYHVAQEIFDNKKTSSKTTVFGLASLACHLFGDKAALSTLEKKYPQVPAFIQCILDDQEDFEKLQSAVSNDPQSRPSLKDLVAIFERMHSALII